MGTDGSTSPISDLLRDIGLGCRKPAVRDEATGELMRLANEPLLLNRMLTGCAGVVRPPPVVDMPELSVINEARLRHFPTGSGLSSVRPSPEGEGTSLHPESFVPTEHDMRSALCAAVEEKLGTKRQGLRLGVLVAGAVLLVLGWSVFLS